VRKKLISESNKVNISARILGQLGRCLFPLTLALYSVSGVAIDCKKKLSVSEKTICQSGTLRKYDQIFNDLFNKAKRASGPLEQVALVDAARQWQQGRDKCALDEKCLSRAYLYPTFLLQRPEKISKTGDVVYEIRRIDLGLSTLNIIKSPNKKAHDRINKDIRQHIESFVCDEREKSHVWAEIRSADAIGKNLVVEIVYDLSCYRSAYPVSGTSRRVYELSEGSHIELSESVHKILATIFFNHYERALRKEMGGPSYKDSFRNSDLECLGVIKTTDFVEWGLDVKGLYLSPSLPKVVQACGTSYIISWIELRKYLNEKPQKEFKEFLLSIIPSGL